MAETWTPVGKVTPTPKGAWSSSTTYARLDIVSNDGSSYIAIQGVPAGTAITNTTYWQKFADKGDTGDTGATGNGIASIVVTETSVSGAEHNYRMAITMTSGSVTNVDYTVTDGAVTSVNGRTGAVTGLAEDDGYYENMTVGSADQLISSVNIEDKVPYVFRTSGGANDIGDREVDEIVGGTIAWNQKSINGNFVGTDNWIQIDSGNASFSVSDNIGKITAVSSSAGQGIKGTLLLSINHVYLGLLKIKGETSGHKFGVSLNGESLTWCSIVPATTDLPTSWTEFGGMAKPDTQTLVNQSAIRIAVTTATALSTGDFYSVKEVQVFDLTQMFGSTIANYIYSLEQANAGAGVAWFKSLFPKPYYAYNAGQLISVSGLSAHKMIGFNQFDIATSVSGETVNASTGAINTASGMWRSDYIRVVGNASYCLVIGSTTSNHFVAWYDANKGFIERTSSASTNVRTVTAPSNACYAIIAKYTNSDSKDMRAEVCFNLSWDGERDGEYEPYEIHEYALDSSLTLRGIPKLDANNEFYYDGDEYANDGTVTRRYGIVDLGTLNWTKHTSGYFYAGLPLSQGWPVGTEKHNAICTNYLATKYSDVVNKNVDKSFNIAYSTHYAYVYDSSLESGDATAFKTAMSGVMLVYELATPTTESAEPYTTIQQVSNWGTEEYVIAEQNGVALPVGHLTRYTQDLRAKLEMAPQSPSAGNGDYVVRQTNGINEYVKLVIPTELPTAPSSDGNYTLKCTVSGGTATYSWVSE